MYVCYAVKHDGPQELHHDALWNDISWCCLQNSVVMRWHLMQSFRLHLQYACKHANCTKAPRINVKQPSTHRSSGDMPSNDTWGHTPRKPTSARGRNVNVCLRSLMRVS
jgi:hypothetical protein